jgi:hypothetical protein
MWLQLTYECARRYGWLPTLCNETNMFICEFAQSSYACPPPSPPPPPPPLPPSPPSPPAPPMCAPVQNATFFCSQLGDECYLLRNSPTTFQIANDVCTAVGGKLVNYRAGFDKQLLLERYFNASGWVSWQSRASSAQMSSQVRSAVPTRARQPAAKHNTRGTVHFACLQHDARPGLLDRHQPRGFHRLLGLAGWAEPAVPDDEQHTIHTLVMEHGLLLLR